MSGPFLIFGSTARLRGCIATNVSFVKELIDRIIPWHLILQIPNQGTHVSQTLFGSSSSDSLSSVNQAAISTSAPVSS